MNPRVIVKSYYTLENSFYFNNSGNVYVNIYSLNYS